MIKKIFKTAKGDIHYLTNEFFPNRKSLIFLPGLTCDNSLFEKQLAFFKNDYNCLVWDPPGHSASRPFSLDFSILDLARYLYEILNLENIKSPILIGQSMGGYISQSFIQEYPKFTKAYISIDSGTLKRKYYSSMELWLLKNIKFLFNLFSWKKLKKTVVNMSAVTDYGKKIMFNIIEKYDKKEYVLLSAYGYRIFVEAIELNLPYKIDCPAILICGNEDKAGPIKKNNIKMSENENLPLKMVKNAGHNSNCDNPDSVNHIINDFINDI